MVEPFLLSLKLAVSTSTLLLLPAVPLAVLFSSLRFKGKGLVELLLRLPLTIPPVVFGFLFIALFSPVSPVGRAVFQVTGIRLVFSFTGLIVSSVIYMFPIMFVPVKNAAGKISREQFVQARLMGRSGSALFFSVIIPQILPDITAAYATVFAHVLGQFGLVLIVGGNIPGETKLASITIYEAIERLDFQNAFILSGIFAVVGIGVLWLISCTASSRGRV